MNQIYIPIIGQMSAGKSNFLNAFLGLEVLETGISTTTKFICLIKNNNYTSFYHVIPSKKNGYLYFNKEGKEISNLEEIKNKIKTINENLDKSKGNKNDLFYCLETPIKNKTVCELLGKYIFMDIPGLNEDKANYFDEVFSLFTLNDIFFEIFLFDAEDFQGDKMIKIIKKLKDKKCLKLNKNLYILNKIDKRPDPEEAIKKFKKTFYDNFLDDKNQIEVEINIFNDNEFVPLSSLLYQAEIRYKDDYFYFLLIILFEYIKELSKRGSFVNFLEEKLEIIISQNKIDGNMLEEETLSESDIEIIKNSLLKIDRLTTQVRKDNGFNLGFGSLDDDYEVQDEIKKLFIIFKKQLYKNYCFSKNYQALESAIKRIITEENLESPPAPIENPNKITIDNDDVLFDMLNFFKKNLKNQFEENSTELKVIRDNLYGNKIRLAFIGNISVGKSTLLNCIIGEDILPTHIDDCTFRVIIIKHKDINDYFLYQTKEVEFGRGTKKYISFIEKEKYCCKGIERIQSYLTTKNSDKKMNEKDTVLILQGRLKIFELIKFDKNLIEKIEFMDLPGLNRNDKCVLDKNFYDKILEYSNSCLYINIPTINDTTNVNNILENYNNDKKNISITIRNEFLSTCLFIINRADEINDDKDKKKIEKYLIDIISKAEKDKNVAKEINICFFSALNFFKYLENYKFYVEMLEVNPFSVLYLLYEKYSGKSKKTFNKFVSIEIDGIAENLKMKLNKKLLPTDDFNKSLKNGFNQFFQALDIKFTKNEEDEIIKKLYGINYELKNHDFSQTNFSLELFKKLREVIIKCDNLQKRNLKLMINQFFQELDIFFNKESIIEMEKQREKKKKKI